MSVNQGNQKEVGAEKVEEAKQQIEQVEERLEKTLTRAELAQSRTELAEARTALAETRAALAETRAEQAETTLQRLIQTKIESTNGSKPQSLDSQVSNGIHERTEALDGLTSRQREILQHIAEGKNTKQIAEILKISPKTVEYHRGKLMLAVGVHDVPGLVRLAICTGLVPAEC